MIKFAIRRFLTMIPQIIILSLLVFLLAQAMPGDALTGQIDPNVSPEVIAAQREALGLNNPWYIQYRDWVSGILQGDFGRSFQRQLPVTEVIGQRLYNTIWLSFFTIVLIYAIAIPLGVISGRYNDTWKDRIITTYTYIGFGIPIFIFSLLMIYLFGFYLRWFPTSGSVSPGVTSADGFAYLLSRLRHMILPALSVALISTVGTVQFLRGEIIDTKHKEFIITARAKGASERRVYNKHIFRNSLLPIASFLGFELAFLIGGAVIVESIFGYPGMGELFLTSIMTRDSSVMTALILLSGVIMIVSAFISDILLMIVDPRIEIK